MTLTWCSVHGLCKQRSFPLPYIVVLAAICTLPPPLIFFRLCTHIVQTSRHQFQSVLFDKPNDILILEDGSRRSNWYHDGDWLCEMGQQRRRRGRNQHGTYLQVPKRLRILSVACRGHSSCCVSHCHDMHKPEAMTLAIFGAWRKCGERVPLKLWLSRRIKRRR